MRLAVANLIFAVCLVNLVARPYLLVPEDFAIAIAACPSPKLRGEHLL